jgi:hypothetical protein
MSVASALRVFDCTPGAHRTAKDVGVQHIDVLSGALRNRSSQLPSGLSQVEVYASQYDLLRDTIAPLGLRERLGLNGVTVCAINAGLDLHPIGMNLAREASGASAGCPNCAWDLASTMRFVLAQFHLDRCCVMSAKKNLLHGVVWWLSGCHRQSKFFPDPNLALNASAPSSAAFAHPGWSLFGWTMPLVEEVVYWRERVDVCVTEGYGACAVDETAWMTLLMHGKQPKAAQAKPESVWERAGARAQKRWVRTAEELAHGLGHGFFFAAIPRQPFAGSGVDSETALVGALSYALGACEEAPAAVDARMLTHVHAALGAEDRDGPFAPGKRSDWSAHKFCACGAIHGFFNSFPYDPKGALPSLLAVLPSAQPLPRLSPQHGRGGAQSRAGSIAGRYASPAGVWAEKACDMLFDAGAQSPPLIPSRYSRFGRQCRECGSNNWRTFHGIAVSPT